MEPIYHQFRGTYGLAYINIDKIDGIVASGPTSCIFLVQGITVEILDNAQAMHEAITHLAHS
jgi:hypothetical protein